MNKMDKKLSIEMYEVKKGVKHGPTYTRIRARGLSLGLRPREIEAETEIEGDRASGPKFETETEIEGNSGEAAGVMWMNSVLTYGGF